MKNIRVRRAFWLAVGVLLGPAVALAATFNLFSPANGILKGNPSTYVTTAAVSSDVSALWSGTCNSTTFLRGDGSCVAAGSGSVTSVGLSAPSVFSVAGSPVTTSGTLALTFATGQTQNQVLASPNGSSGAVSLRALVAADIPAISLTTGVSGILPGANGGTNNGFMAFTGPTTSLKTFTLPNATATILTTNAAVTVAQGGTGAATLTGPLKGNGTSAFTVATAADILGLWSGTCNSTTFLRGDGSCQTPAAASGANPTGTIGLTAVNGVATTFVRSDGAPALSQAIVPTWTGQHIFQVASGEPVILKGSAAGASSVSYLQFQDSTGVRTGYVGDGSSGNSTITLIADSGPLALSSNGVARVSFDTDGSWDLAGTTPGTAGQVFTSNGAGSAPTWQAGGSGSPGGSTTQMQYNNAGAFGGAASLTYTSGSSTLANSGPYKSTAVWSAADVTSFPISIESSSPAMMFYNTGGAANNRRWMIYSDTSPTNTISFNSLSDAGSSQGSFLSAAATSAVVSAVTLQTSSTGTTTIGASGGSATATIQSGIVKLPSIPNTNTAVQGAVCWATGGNLSYNSASTCLTSSERFKRDIKDLSGGLTTLMDLRPVSFEIKPEFDPAHQGQQVGFIAEEVQKVDSRLMFKGTDGKALGVRYDQITAVLVLAVQQQQQQIYALWFALMCSIVFTVYRTRRN